MPVYDWRDPETERKAIEREQARRKRVEQYRSSPEAAAQAQAVSQMARYYPTMSPGLAVPMALGGAAPNSPEAARIATAEAKKNKRQRGTFGAIGDFMLDAAAKPFEALDAIGGIAGELAKPVSRYGMAALSAPFELGTGVLRNVAAAGGEIVAGAAAGGVTGAGIGLFAGGAGALPGAAIGAIAGGIAGGVAQMRGVNVEGQFRNPIAQTTLGQDIFGGKDIGEGYLPGGTAYEAQAVASRQAASIKGHAFTPGRFLAAAAFDVDSNPYKVLSGAIDLSNAWKLDPASVGGKALGVKMAKARKFVPQLARAEETVRLAAGAADHGNRPAILVEAMTQWLTADKRGQGFVELMRTTDEFDDMRKLLPGVAPETLLELADARTTDDVLRILTPSEATGRGMMLERGLSERPAVATAAGQAKARFGDIEVVRRFTGSRLFADMPGGEMNLLDSGGALDTFTALQKTGKISDDGIARNNRALAEALRDQDYKRAIRVITEPFAGVDGVLHQAGMPEEFTKKLTNLFLSSVDDLERKALFEQGMGTRVSNLDIAGQSFDLAAPSVLSSDLGTVFKIDRKDVRAMRQATSWMAPMYNHPVAGDIVRNSVAVGDFMTSQVWKPFALLRGAYTVRVIAEEQIRMANSGVDSLFAHPLSYLAWMATDDGRLGKVLDRLGVTVSRGDVDVLGKAFTEAPEAVEKVLRGHGNEFAAGLGRKANKEGWLDGHVRQQTAHVWRRGEKGYSAGLTEQIATMHGDPLLRRIAAGGKLPDDPQTFHTGSGAVRHWLENTDEGRDVRRVVGGLTSPMDVDDQLVKSRKVIDDIVGRDPKTTMGGDVRIQRAIAEGHLDGVPIYDKRGRITKEFRAKVDEIVESGNGPMSVTGPGYDTGGLKDNWDRAVEWGFSAFMGNRTAQLSRSPYFRQYYWKEAERLAFALNPEDQARLLANMDAAELPAAMKEAVRKAAAKGTGDLSLEQADTLLKGRALDSTRDLLYDVSKRGQLSDIMRVIWPFAEAQKEVMKTWAKLATRNPQLPRRAHQVLQGGRGEAGVFYTDPQTGEQMFTYPLSGLLTEKVFGIPIPLGNRVEGLSVFGSGVMPGFGPVIQLSARWFLPDVPATDQIREIVDPFGESAEGGVLEQFGPAWIKSLITGINMDDQSAAFGNDMFDIFSAGLSSGEYGNSTPEEIEEGMESAKHKARWLFIIRGGAMALGAPSPPRPEFLAMDKDGRWGMMDALVKEYRALADDPEIGLDGANEAFLTKFGVDVFGLVQPSTYTGGKILPDSTGIAGEWARDHPDIAKRYPNIYGLFAPSDPEADFDIAVWARQKRTDERVPMDPDQRAKYNNDKLASTVFWNVKNRFGSYPNKGQKAYLSDLNARLQAEFPGYQENIGLPEKVDTDQRIAEFSRALEDPDLADSPIARPSQIYLAIRNRLNEAVKSSGAAESVADAKAAAPMRAYLRDLAERLATESPEFRKVWDRVFEPELKDDTTALEGISA